MRSIKTHNEEEDSDDFADDEYNSHKFGKGTSKVVANHYQALQNKRASEISPSNLNVEDFEKIQKELA